MTDLNPVVQRDQASAAGQGGAVAQRRDEAPAMTLIPAVDIFETAAGVTLWADLPGVPREKLEVNVHDSNLRIEGEAVLPMPAGLRVQHAEVRQPRYARTFTLSPDLDASAIQANLQDGVLKLTIPRRDEARPRRIEVSVG
ncbi:Hsp20/alpha crystallin family protein [Cupriavidus taiwanensis]|uniref:Heat shock chaperone, Hsp20 family n=1 Tax=Cupriavidus taiwanensis TaxID=164546 RepID=A0A7Z7J9K6_9BURK|nr:Hsp20/alpha crystallin family protein [Cupriavidus taiwanensis]SOY85632.1 Heat shock chaperone, Hsp20 family [Cupriavidus taiwanensis]SOZ02258.1 Heat shock chaperone, Hsp20 family [Cupriavidus taiwanensis]SOZ05247.1 Heat shock chaperone, Hsp20 family [Cupriavidus taiwanensis]SPC09731.1 Heat shock chaperone, Hsp20 family [Cupriavidus taiwanensis]SPD39516.1 Heat shock chaperone, Hsp20 family [Cupriavidus taiwanensis]